MGRFVWTAFVLASLSLHVSAQAGPQPGAPSQASKPVVRVCVAKFKNETRQQVNVVDLRDRLSAYLKRGALATSSKAEFLVLSEDTDQAAAPEIRDQKCDFAVYTRVLMGRLRSSEPAPTDNPMRTYTAKTKPDEKAPPALVTGMQFTVIRISSEIPILIDRAFLDKEIPTDEELWKLLLVLQERIEASLEKKLAPKPA